MSLNLNKVTVIGNITKDIELKSLPSGVKVASFSVATNRVWYNEQKQKQEEVEYHNIVVFGKQAENVAQYMSKGSNILIEGRLKTQSWEDTATKKKMYRTEIIAENVQFGSRKESTSQQTSSSIQYPENEEVAPREKTGGLEDEINPEDIPF